MGTIQNTYTNPLDSVNGFNNGSMTQFGGGNAINFNPGQSSATTSSPTTTPQPQSNSANPYNPLMQTSYGGGQNFYRNDLGGGWNPMQYATDQRTNQLANMFGGVPTKTASTEGTASPFGIPQQNVLQFGNGFNDANAGLIQGLLDMSGGNVDFVRRQLADQAKIAQGSSLGVGTNAGLVGYDPSLTQPRNATQVSPFTGISSAQQSALAPQTTLPTQPTTQSNPNTSNVPSTQAYSNQNNFMSSLMPMLFLSMLMGGGGGGFGGGGGLGSLVSLLGMLGGQQQLPQFPSSNYNNSLYPGF
jgi:hypothetical protein